MSHQENVSLGAAVQGFPNHQDFKSTGMWCKAKSTGMWCKEQLFGNAKENVAEDGKPHQIGQTLSAEYELTDGARSNEGSPIGMQPETRIVALETRFVGANNDVEELKFSCEQEMRWTHKKFDFEKGSKSETNDQIKIPLMDNGDEWTEDNDETFSEKTSTLSSSSSEIDFIGMMQSQGTGVGTSTQVNMQTPMYPTGYRQNVMPPIFGDLREQSQETQNFDSTDEGYLAILREQDFRQKDLSVRMLLSHHHDAWAGLGVGVHLDSIPVNPLSGRAHTDKINELAREVTRIGKCVELIRDWMQARDEMAAERVRHLERCLRHSRPFSQQSRMMSTEENKGEQPKKQSIITKGKQAISNLFSGSNPRTDQRVVTEQQAHIPRENLEDSNLEEDPSAIEARYLAELRAQHEMPPPDGNNPSLPPMDVMGEHLHQNTQRNAVVNTPHGADAEHFVDAEDIPNENTKGNGDDISSEIDDEEARKTGSDDGQESDDDERTQFNTLVAGGIPLRQLRDFEGRQDEDIEQFLAEFDCAFAKPEAGKAVEADEEKGLALASKLKHNAWQYWLSLDKEQRTKYSYVEPLIKKYFKNDHRVEIARDYIVEITQGTDKVREFAAKLNGYYKTAYDFDAQVLEKMMIPTFISKLRPEIRTKLRDWMAQKSDDENSKFENILKWSVQAERLTGSDEKVKEEIARLKIMQFTKELYEKNEREARAAGCANAYNQQRFSPHQQNWNKASFGNGKPEDTAGMQSSSMQVTAGTTKEGKTLYYYDGKEKRMFLFTGQVTNPELFTIGQNGKYEAYKGPIFGIPGLEQEGMKAIEDKISEFGKNLEDIKRMIGSVQQPNNQPQKTNFQPQSRPFFQNQSPRLSYQPPFNRNANFTPFRRGDEVNCFGSEYIKEEYNGPLVPPEEAKSAENLQMIQAQLNELSEMMARMQSPNNTAQDNGVIKMCAELEKNTQSLKNRNLGVIDAKINGISTTVLLDTGANKTITSVKMAIKLGIKVIPFESSATGVDTVIKLVGIGKCNLTIMGITKKVDLVFIDSDNNFGINQPFKMLVGGNALGQFPPITFDFADRKAWFSNKPRELNWTDEMEKKEKADKEVTPILSANENINLNMVTVHGTPTCWRLGIFQADEEASESTPNQLHHKGELDPNGIAIADAKTDRMHITQIKKFRRPTPPITTNPADVGEKDDVEFPQKDVKVAESTQDTSFQIGDLVHMKGFSNFGDQSDETEKWKGILVIDGQDGTNLILRSMYRKTRSLITVHSKRLLKFNSAAEKGKADEKKENPNSISLEEGHGRGKQTQEQDNPVELRAKYVAPHRRLSPPRY